MAWNLSAAIKHLVTHASSSAKHQCAKYVRMAIEAGGLSTAGRPVSACDYKDFLPNIGFRAIGKIYGKSNQASWTNKSARPGDIAVMDHGVHGHICMYSGQRWISDFVQNNMWVYGGDGMCYIFRYNGEIDPTLDAYLSFNDTGLRYIVPLEQQQDHICLENLGKLKYNILSEILESSGAMDLAMNNTIIYENELTRDDSSLSESIVMMGLWMDSEFNGDLDSIFNEGLSLEDMKSINPGSVTSCGLSQGMLMLIAFYETGKKFGYNMASKDLNGYDLGDANGHKTYGYGLLYHPNGRFMDSIKKTWTQQELEQLYLYTIKKMVDKVKGWASGLNLEQNQIDSIVCASYNFGIGFLKFPICNLIKKNPNNPQIFDIWCHLSDKQGKKFPGLIKRRKTEAAWYFGKQK